MRKGLAIFTLSLVVLSVQAYAQSHKAQKGSDSQKPATQAPLIPIQQTGSPKLQPEQKQHIDADVRVVGAPAKDGYDRAAFWINVALACVGFSGIAIGVCTLFIIKRQTDLQAAAMQQWIDVETLGCYIQTPPAGATDFPFTINLLFEAVNNTPYPLDIQKIVTKVGMWPYEWEVFTVETSVTLASQEKSRNKRYAFYVPTQSITKEAFKSGTVLTINGEITFRNRLGKAQNDYFGGVYRCGQIDSGQKGIFQYLEALGIVPERTNEKENPPNPN